MRTKKILSVLMVIFMLATMFGIVGAHAEEETEVLALAEVLVEEETDAVEDEAIEEAAEPAPAEAAPVEAAAEVVAAAPVEAAAPVDAAAAAEVAWPSAVNLDDAAAYAGGWDQGLVEWNPFTATTGIKDGVSFTLKDSFKDHKDNKEVTLKWDVWYYDEAGARQPIVVETVSYEALRRPIAAYAYDTGSKIQLVIKQGTTKFYGDIHATLTVTAPSAAKGEVDKNGERVMKTEVSPKIIITLRDPKWYHELVEKAQKILDKSSRYLEDYATDLGRVVNAANRYKDFYPGDATIERIETDLRLRIASAPANVKLTGWEWFDNLLGVKFIGFIWKAIDVFGFIGKIWGIISPAFSAIGSFFGAIFKIFGIFTPIFGLFS